MKQLLKVVYFTLFYDILSLGDDMKENTLVIMAAGLGSRFKGGIKQLEPVGPNGEAIMDYSIYDAYQAGFREVILIVREDFQATLDTHFKNKLPKDLRLRYVYQKVEDIPESYSFKERTKPWGTGQAILICKELIQGPFTVINADDYYGASAFSVMQEYRKDHNENCMVGYVLKNTLSDHGTVNRGICEVVDGKLKQLHETYQISASDGIAVGKDLEDHLVQIDLNSYCSMNFFGFTEDLFEKLEKGFNEFLKQMKNPEKDEFLIPTFVNELLMQGRITLQVLPTNEEWFGMTYQEDKEEVKRKIEQFILEGKYPKVLWES